MYRYQEFPKVVYGPNGEWREIASEDERPEGYGDTQGISASPADERTALKLFLDQHSVEYPANLSLVKLRGLAEQLRTHLTTAEK